MGGKDLNSEGFRKMRLAPMPRADGWPEPIPLMEHALPAYPSHALPGPLFEWVEAEAEATQTPLDLAGMLVLGVVAGAVAGKFRVAVRGGWTEPLNLYVCVSADPGERKSAVFDHGMRPVYEAERALVASTSPDREAKARDLRFLTKQRDKTENAATRTGGDPEKRDDLRRQVAEIEAEMRRIEVPPEPVLVVGDVTPEALAIRLAEQGGRLIAASAEGGELVSIMGGRYSRTGAPNFEIFLKAHAGDRVRVDRVGRPPIFIDRPRLTLVLAVQPDVMRGFASCREFRGRGMHARFLYANPSPMAGRCKIYGVRPMSGVEIQRYRDTVESLLALTARTDENGRPVERDLEFEPEALELLDAYREKFEPRRAPGSGDLGYMGDWASKHVGSLVRVAGGLHLVEHARDNPERPIRRATLESALVLGGYFIAHARAAYAEMGADPAIGQARTILAWIRRRGALRFTTHDLMSGCKTFRTVDEAKAALDLLAEHQHIAAVLPEPGRVGRPSKGFDVNPRTLSAKSAESAEEPAEGDFADSADCADRGPGSHPAPDGAGDVAP